MQKYGTVRINLAQLMERSKLSKTKLCQRAEMQPTQLNKFYRNQITQLDIDVLARLCTTLECDIGDLLEFIPPQPDEPKDREA